MLPQRHPFRLVDRREDDAVAVALSSDATLLRGQECSLTLAVEILAQAALLVMSSSSASAEAGGESGESAAFLGGIDDARLLQALRPGDRLLAYATVAGRLGVMVKLATRLERRGERVAEATLLLVRSPAA
jgi:3-hydroxymyristoyl/3-hydroxydecanoyl-(acyl carrier protein) dehydratase